MSRNKSEPLMRNCVTVGRAWVCFRVSGLGSRAVAFCKMAILGLNVRCLLGVTSQKVGVISQWALSRQGTSFFRPGH
jgi:hypothetical protein